MRWLAFFAALSCALANAQESDPGPGLRFNGFGTLGLTHADVTQPWGFHRDANQPSNDGGTRADIDSRLGLQANYAIDAQFELVGQVQLKRRVSSSRAQESLEWAFLSYRATPDLTFRLGRTGPDIFLLSDYRSVGFAYPQVRPDTETYGLLPIFSIEGADVSRVWNVGDARWRAKAFAGRGRTRAAGPPESADLDFRMRSVFGAMVSRESGGLLLRATVARFRGGLGSDPRKAQLRSALDALQAVPLAQVADEARRLADRLDPDEADLTYVALGASYERNDWLLTSELVRVSSPLSYAAANTGYVNVGRRFGAFTAYGVLGRARSYREAPATPQWQAALEPVLGRALAQQAQTTGAAAALSISNGVDQRSASLGLRWDLHPQMALKLQFDRILVGRNGSILWGRRSLDAASAKVASVALDFVY